MKQTVNLYHFRDAFKAHGRENQFSYEALGQLFSYFEAYEQDTGEEIELDVVAICCEYAEATLAEIVRDYSIDTSDIDKTDSDALFKCVVSYLQEHTEVIGDLNDGSKIIYQKF